MFERILAAVDDSARAQLVMAMARDLAERAGGALVALRVRTGAQREAVTEEDLALSEQTGALRSAGMAAHYLVHTGAPEQQIIETAQRQRSTLIIIASRAASPRALMGRRMTTRLAVRAPAPVLVIPERGAAPAAELFGGDDAPILVALDGSDLAEEALPYAGALADLLGRPLTLLHVASPLKSQEQVAQAWAYVERASERMRERISRGQRVDAQVVSGAPVDELLWAVEGRRAGALVLTAYGQHVPSARHISHITRDTVERLRIPALLIPASILSSGARGAQPAEPRTHDAAT